MIPKPLKNDKFKFLLLIPKSKKPTKEMQNWSEANLEHDNPFLLNHLENDGNYGIIGGYGNLIIIDSDSKLISDLVESKLPETFTSKTGSVEPYKKHYYFITDKPMKPIRLSEAKLGDLGDVRSKGQYVVAPGSTHPSGNKYKVIKDRAITKITESLIRITFRKYIDPEDNTELSNKTYPIITTKRSSKFIRNCLVPDYVINNKMKAETSKNWKLFPYLVDILYNREVSQEVYETLCKKQGHSIGAIKGWVKKAHEGKLARSSCEKMKHYLERFHPELVKELCDKCLIQSVLKKEAEAVEFETYDDKDLINYETPEQEWIIENQIPKGEVGLLAGKRGDRKTFTALYQAICITAKKKVFGEDEVPEKMRVFIIEEETGKPEIAKRIKALKKGLKLEKEILDIKFSSFSGLKLDRKDKKFTKFMQVLQDFKPHLIIIDCLQRVVTFEVDKDNASISALFTETIRPIIKRFGCSWLFIHHLRKSPASRYRPEDPLDEIRGGSELTNYCRFVLLCQTPRGQQTSEEGGEFIVFRVLKMSNAAIPEPKVISFTSNDDSIKVNYEGIPEDVLSGEVQAAKGIKTWLFDKQLTEFKTKDITEASEEIGFKRTLLSAGLKVLLKNGFLSKEKRGNWAVSGDISQNKLGGEKVSS